MRILAALLPPAACLILAACGSANTDPPSPAATTLAPAHAARSASNRDWPTFGGDPQRTSASEAPTGITAANAHRLRRATVALPGTVDSTPIYLHGVRAGGRTRDLFVVTTSYGRTLAVDAARGTIVWTFQPKGYASWEGSAQITTATPVAAADRKHIYAADPGGRIHRLSVSGGHEATAGGRWPVSLTLDPTHEKLPSPLNLAGGRVIVTTGGYVGDAPPYQGHVVTLDERTGAILGVFNSLCSDRKVIQQPSTCRSSASAIWGRAGAVVERGSGKLLVATGNGPFDGRADWGDSTLELSPTAEALLQNWTPTNQKQLEDADIDVGSVSPVLLPGGGVLQSGKEGEIDVLRADRLNGRGGAGPTLGGETQVVRNPGGAGMVGSAMAVRTRGAETTVFATTNTTTAAYRWKGGRLARLWSNEVDGTTPLVAGGLLYIYDAGSGELLIRRPDSGKVVTKLSLGTGHWNSPVIGGGRLALPEGSANDHAKTGTLDLFTLR